MNQGWGKVIVTREAAMVDAGIRHRDELGYKMLRTINFNRSLATDLGIALMMALFYLRSIWFDGPGSHLLDEFDNRSFVWFFEWLHHSIFGAGKIAETLSPNIFYPNLGTLAWSDMAWGFLPIYSLARAVTNNPIFAYNFCSLFFSILTCFAFLRLGRKLTGSLSIVPALVGGIGLVAAGQELHLQLKAIGLFLCYALNAWKYVEQRSARHMLLALFFLTWTFHCSVYILIITFYLTVLVLAAGACTKPRYIKNLIGDLVFNLKSPVVLLTCFLLGGSIAFSLYFYLQALVAQNGAYTLAEAVVYSARPLSLLDAPSVSYLYPPLFSDWGSHEAKIMMGVIPYLLLIYLLSSGSIYRGMRAAIVILIGVFFVTLMLSWGPYLRGPFESGTQIPLPGYLAWSFLPGFSVLRTAGRFGLFAAAALGLLADVGLKSAFKNRLRVGYYGICLLVVVEQLTVFNPKQVELYTDKDFYLSLREHTAPTAVIVELPITKREHFDTMSWYISQQINSTLHLRRLIIGYSSKSSPQVSELQYLWATRKDQGLLKVLSRVLAIGATDFIVDRPSLETGEREEIVAMLEQLGCQQKKSTSQKELWGKCRALPN